jgi:hypothetical protein
MAARPSSLRFVSALFALAWWATAPDRPLLAADTPLRIIELYGPERARQVEYAEAFEVCEYGRRPDKEEIRRLFPFFP